LLLNFRTDEQDMMVDVRRQDGRWLLNIEGQEVPLQADLDHRGCWLVDTHQGRRRLWVAVRGDERLVFCDGRVHSFRLPDPENEDVETDTTAGPNLVANMPGKVVRVLAGPGALVQAGQTLVIMESMKMETELEAAVGGEIQTVHVEDGQVVAQGDILVTIAPGE
jgi:3-methylcrotonyl-CoA carboxylase alpha subunit